MCLLLTSARYVSWWNAVTLWRSHCMSVDAFLQFWLCDESFVVSNLCSVLFVRTPSMLWVVYCVSMSLCVRLQLSAHVQQLYIVSLCFVYHVSCHSVQKCCRLKSVYHIAPCVSTISVWNRCHDNKTKATFYTHHTFDS